jgi:hypothetical protein
MRSFHKRTVVSTYPAGKPSARWPRALTPCGALALLALAGCDAGPFAATAATDAVIRARFEALHRPLYEVYAIGDDRDALWRALAASFAGEALTGEYVEHFTALRRMTRERTQIRVLEVDYEEVAVRREGEGWLVDADWSIGGVVTHQGHRHPRINRYRATYQLAFASDSSVKRLEGLRIVGTTLRSLERVASARGSGFPLDELPASARGSLSLSDLLRSGALAEQPSAPGAVGGASQPEPERP